MAATIHFGLLLNKCFLTAVWEKVHCLGRKGFCYSAKQKCTSTFPLFLPKGEEKEKLCLQWKQFLVNTRFPLFFQWPSHLNTITSPTLFWKPLTCHCMSLHCHATERQLRYTGSHEVNEQFVKHFLIVQQERSNQKVGPVASLPVTMPTQHHFLKDYSFHLLTFFQCVPRNFSRWVFVSD